VLKMNIKGELTTFGEFAFYNTHRTLLMSARKQLTKSKLCYPSNCFLSAVTILFITYQTESEGEVTPSLKVRCGITYE
jgi:hypothetical protein